MRKEQMFINVVLIHTVISVIGITAEKVAPPPIPCKDAKECRERLSTNAECNNGHCMCLFGNELQYCLNPQALLTSNKTTPLVSRTCTHDQDCKLENGFCNTTIRQCDCLRGFVASSSKQRCLKAAESIGASCIDEKQCLVVSGKATCRDDACACIKGYHPADNACWKTVEFGMPCVQSQECSHIDGAECTKSKLCGCANETVISADARRCLPIATAMSDNCTENSQCSTVFLDSECIAGKCQCREYYHFESTLSKCVITRGLDEKCEDSYECYQPEVDANTQTLQGRSEYCLANYCECSDGFDREDEKCVASGASVATPSVFFAGASMAILILTSSSIKFQ